MLRVPDKTALDEHTEKGGKLTKSSFTILDLTPRVSFFF